MEENTKDFCCPILTDYALKIERYDLIDYESNVRAYRFSLYDLNGEKDMHLQPFQFCPWCGTELPTKLDEEWGVRKRTWSM